MRDAGEIKKIRHMKDYEKSSLIVSEVFGGRGEVGSWSYDENLAVYVDRVRRVRFCKREVGVVDT